MTITRINATDFDVQTDTVLSDGSLLRDTCCRLAGNMLRSHEQRGDVRPGGLLRVTLGPQSYAAVTALAIGESVEFPYISGL